jgi:hypothetical protein
MEASAVAVDTNVVTRRRNAAQRREANAVEQNVVWMEASAVAVDISAANPMAEKMRQQNEEAEPR